MSTHLLNIFHSVKSEVCFHSSMNKDRNVLVFQLFEMFYSLCQEHFHTFVQQLTAETRQEMVDDTTKHVELNPDAALM